MNRKTGIPQILIINVWDFVWRGESSMFPELKLLFYMSIHKQVNIVFFFSQVSCKVSQFIHLYLMGCNYFWMLCEGIYLHTLIVVAVFAEKQHLMWYYFLGWGKCHYTYLLIQWIKKAFGGCQVPL